MTTRSCPGRHRRPCPKKAWIPKGAQRCEFCAQRRYAKMPPGADFDGVLPLAPLPGSRDALLAAARSAGLGASRTSVSLPC